VVCRIMVFSPVFARSPGEGFRRCLQLARNAL